MRPARGPLWLGLLGALVSACYAGSARSVSPSQASALTADPSWIVVPDVPFVAQQSDEDCGPAALAMVLRRFGVPVTLAEVTAAEPPKDGGVRAGDLRNFARGQGLQAFVVAGTFDDLFGELGRGHPVLVGLAKPMTGGRAQAHYEVVVAINRRARQLLTLDPGRGLRENSLEGFAREWAPTGRVTLIAFRPPRRPPDAAPVATGGGRG
jgi:ABC-type bacteriocin/lantibiotic exporter with double-glycine peptidase domain